MSKYAKRLRKLADFIEPMRQNKFDFQNMVTRRNADGCGTTCCALGWCPVVFKKDWRWDGSTVAQRNSQDSPFVDAQRFFGMSQDEVDQAFVPWEDAVAFACIAGSDAAKGYGAERVTRGIAAKYGYCMANATGRAVAANLRRLADIVEARR